MGIVDISQSSERIPCLFNRVCVIGGGSWGTALGIIADKAGRDVSIWCRDSRMASELVRTRENGKYLPGVSFSKPITASSSMAEVVDADLILIVTPSTSIRDVSRQLARHVAPGVPVLVCAKGVEESSGLLMSEVVGEELTRNPVGVLSGPTFAKEAALGHPTAVTIASSFEGVSRPEETVAARAAVSLGSEFFRPYLSDDVIGVEIGGAVKNVIAIACGMMTGAGFAENTRAALITRGLDEMKLLAEAMGGRRETVTGLSGIGDLTLTCSSTTSRNMSLGVQLGSGRKRGECFDGRPVVVEGERNARSVTDLARRAGVEMPICEAVRAILHDGAAIGETFAQLWSRPLEAEPKALDIALPHPADDATIQQFADTIS